MIATRPARPVQSVKLVILGWSCLATVTQLDARQDQIDWRIGVAFHQKLASRVSVTWEDNPLIDGLQALSRSQRVAVFLDRRVDPERRVSTSAVDVTLQDALRQIARETGLGVGYVGPVVYLGPPAAAARVATIAGMRDDDARRLPDPPRSKLLEPKPLQWERLSEPRWIIRKIAADLGLTVPMAATIPHDLWRAGDYPPMTASERLTLVLTGCNKSFTFAPETGDVLLTGFPRRVTMERTYDLEGRPRDVVEDLEREFPQALFRQDGDRLIIQSMAEDHWRLAQIFGGRSRPRQPARAGAKAYTLKVEQQPARRLVEQLAKRLKLQLRITEDVDEQLLEQRVSFNVQEVTVEQLFQAIVEPLELHASVNDGVVTVARDAR